MWIQVILVLAIVFIGILLTRSVPSDSHLALRRLLVFALMLTAIVMILVPEWLTAVANTVGIGRGADLLLYALVLTFMGYLATDYRRNLQARQQVTKLARELALAEQRIADALEARDERPEDPDRRS